MTSRLNRRAVIAALPAAVTAAGCKGHAQEPPVSGPIPPLEDGSRPFPVGTCVSTGYFADPALTALVLQNFSQVTPEWEMKMEAILKDDGGFDFTRSDAIANFAGQHSLRLHAHTLVWYAQKPPGLRADRRKPHRLRQRLSQLHPGGGGALSRARRELGRGE